jgi:hypothetical protein
LSSSSHLPAIVGSRRSRCRPGATGSDEAAAVRIGDACENDGDSACLLQHRRGRGCVVRKNEREERYAYWLSAAREANRDAAPFFTPKLAAVALAGALTVDQQQSNRIIDPRQKMLELYLGMRRRGELTAKVIDAPPKNLSAARTMSARWGEADSKRKLLGMPGAQSGGRMMPGAAYATPHSTERDGRLHSVAPVAPPKRALRFFSHCGLAATRAPESGRSDLLV